MYCIFGYSKVGRATCAGQRETSVGRKENRNRYYMLLPGEIHPSEAENLACVRHRVANIGRQKELITRKTRVTEGSARAASRGV